MPTQILTPEQISKLSEVKSLNLRRRFSLYYQLPQDLQQSMFAEETADTIWSIVKDKHKLADENVSIVARVIGLVMLGEVSVKNFVKELGQELKVSNDKASAIAQDINQQIFQPVRESLMGVHGIVEVDTQRSGASSAQRQIRADQKHHQGISLDELEKKSSDQTSFIKNAKAKKLLDGAVTDRYGPDNKRGGAETKKSG